MKSTPHKTLQKMTALCPASVCSNAKSSGYSKPIATPNKVADSAAKRDSVRMRFVAVGRRQIRRDKFATGFLRVEFQD